MVKFSLARVVVGTGLVTFLVGGGPAREASSPDTRGVRLIRPDDIKYVGAFRVPSTDSGGSSLHYGGTALAFNAARESLYLVGHDWHQKVAEISIPTITDTSNLAALDRARFLQPLTEVSEGRMFTVDEGSIKVGGLMVSGGRLYGTVYSYYDGDVNQSLSHYHRPLDLAVAGAEGMYAVGRRTGFVSGYMTPVPAIWQEALGGPALTGQCCLAIVGRTSLGPSASVFDPLHLGKVHPVPAQMVVGYPLDNAVTEWASTSNFYNGTTEIRGLVFPEGTRSVLFIGRQGIGPFCYGSGASCHDSVDTGQGSHAYPYITQIWAYDVSDLIAIRNAQRRPWDVRPYAIWPFPLPFNSARIGGVAYDPLTQRIFVSQPLADGTLPVIHVFKVDTGSAPPNERVFMNLRAAG